MLKSLNSFRFLLVVIAGWMNQQHVIEYLHEKNCFLRSRIGPRRLRLSDDQRRRLAVKAKLLGWRLLAEFSTIVTPENLLRWHHKLIAQKLRRQPTAGLEMVARDGIEPPTPAFSGQT